MNHEHLKDVYQHMNWADARIWESVLDSSAGASDDYVLDTLMHIQVTQHSFLNVWLERPFIRWKREEFDSPTKQSEWGASFYPEALKYLDSISDEDLADSAVLPWAKYFERTLGREAAETTLLDTLHQLTSHSMHHRGQVARRLRVLEEVPPLTDYIVWVWMGRPAPEWPV